MRNPLYYLGKVIVRGFVKVIDFIDFIDTNTAPGRWWHGRFDQFMLALFGLTLLGNLIRAFIAAPLVTGTVVGVIILVVWSALVYLKSEYKD